MKINRLSGFSLVELSVVLTVIGITLGGALTLATKKTEADKVTETAEKLDKIEDALEQFLIVNQRLPCPADGSLAISDVAFGVEATPSATDCGTTNFDDGANIFAGVVPTKTLNLPDDVMIDGWNRRIDYAVDFHFANNLATSTFCADALTDICFKYNDSGSITINDASGNPRATDAVYVLISHGKNGRGAWTYIGSASRIAASADASELENAGDDEGAFDATFVQKNATTAFDDIVRYRPKWQIVDDANGITENSVCIAANNDPASDVCTDAVNTTICGDLAAQVALFCLND